MPPLDSLCVKDLTVEDLQQARDGAWACYKATEEGPARKEAHRWYRRVQAAADELLRRSVEGE